MTDRELNIRLQDLAATPLGDAIDAASDQGQDTWLTDGEGGKRIARIVTVDETTAAERVLNGQEPGQQLAYALSEGVLLTLVSALRYRLCDAAFRSHWATTKRDTGQLRSEAYGYGKAIEDLYRVAGVGTLPWTPPRLEGHGRLDHSAETIAREWIGPASSDRILGKRP
jgi:hypothetical protein